MSSLKQALKSSNKLGIGKIEFGFTAATAVDVYLIGRDGDVSVPNTQPIVEVHCTIVTIYANKKSGQTTRRKGFRKMYFRIETEKFTRTPNGKKGWDDELTNKDEVIKFIAQCLTGLEG